MKTVTYTFHNETPEELAMDLIGKLGVVLRNIDVEEYMDTSGFIIEMEELKRVLALAHYNKVTKPVSDK